MHAPIPWALSVPMFNFNIDSELLDAINAVWLTPYGIAAKYLFMLSIALIFYDLVKQQKLSIWHAVLVLMGFKQNPNGGDSHGKLPAALFTLCVGLMLYSHWLVFYG